MIAKRSRTQGISIDIPVGTRLNLNFLNQKETFSAEMIGFSIYEYLIMQLPQIPGLRARLIPNETIAVRYIDRGTVFGFVSEVMSSIIRPGFLLFCSYPSSVEQIELRRHQRLNCLLPAIAHTPQGEFHCILQDLSHGGAKLVFKTKTSDAVRQIEADTPITVDFTLFMSKCEVPVPSVVRSVTVDGLKVILGIQFLDLPEQLRNEMGIYLDTVSYLR